MPFSKITIFRRWKIILILVSLGLGLTFVVHRSYSLSQPVLVPDPPVRITDYPDNPSPFHFDNQILSIKTKMLEMQIEGGAITYIADKASGEVLVNSAAYLHWPVNNIEFAGFVVKTSSGSSIAQRPTKSSTAKFSTIDSNHGRLVYSSLGDQNKDPASQLIIDILLEETTGEVVIQLTGLEADGNANPFSVDIPIVNTTTPSVILGSGASYSRTDARVTDQTTYADYGLNSPTVAVVQGTKAVLAAWSESTQFAPDYIRLDHRREYDQIILHAEKSDGQADSPEIVSPPWRIGTYSTWVQAAKRWKQKFEERTGAKPLWENRVPWVRNIHATFDALAPGYGDDKAKYAELAQRTTPERTLFFLWNGDRIVLFGDHTLVDKITRPAPEELKLIKSYGWPLLLYHPYDLIYSDTGTTNRLDFLSGQGWLPANYDFNPDYEGTPQQWQDYWAAVKTSYHDGSKLDVIHPGSTKFEDYLVHNFSNYLNLYQADGAYFDTLGADQGYLFPENKKIIDGHNYVLGEVSVIAATEKNLPNMAIMSEYQSPWILPYVFYSWEGSATHLKQIKYTSSRMNHPLRVALIGSYVWSRESNEEYSDDVTSALMGALPQISLVGDYHVSDERAKWSQARAKLFCDEELFNDLPDQWQGGVLAYYHSHRTGHWFKFQQLGSSYGYLEILEDGTEVARLVK